MNTTIRVIDHGTLDRNLATGQFVPVFTLKYTVDKDGQDTVHIRHLPESGIRTVGRVVANCVNRGTAWDIGVTDKDGNDVTGNFACFN